MSAPRPPTKQEIAEEAYQEMREDVKRYLERVLATTNLNLDVATNAFILATQAVCRHYENSPKVPE